MGPYFEDFRVGNTYVSAPHAVTESEVLSFAREFDPQPFHLDAEAAKHTVFGGLVAGGFHSAALSLRLALDTKLFSQCSIAGLGVDELRWSHPMRPGDTVTLTFTVAQARRSRSQPDRGIVTFHYELHNQQGLLLTSLKITKALKSRPGNAPA